MTKAYVRQYQGLARTEQADSVLAYEENGTFTDSIIDYTAGVAFVDLLPTTRWVTMRVDSIASYVVGLTSATPVAAVTNMRLSAGERVDFAVPVALPPAGTAPVNGKTPATYRISAITNT